jgi:hypothetical protein
MKKLYNVLFFLSVLTFSCSKDSLLNSDQGTDQLLNNSALKTSGLVITVKPNGTDDTPALIDAFEQAKASGQKAVVKLMPGTFKIGSIEVTEFNGKLTGSGQGTTIITNIWDFPTRDDVFQLGRMPALITFIGGNVEVSNLTVKISELNWVVDPQKPQGMPILLFSDYSNTYFPSDHHIQVKVNNIEIINSDQPGVYFGGITFEPAKFPGSETRIPRSNIDATVTNSRFSNLGVDVWGCKSGNFMIGSNIFELGGLTAHQNMGVTVKITKNNIISQYGHPIDINAWDFELGVLEYVSCKVGTYEIRDNIFNYEEMVFGIWDDWRYNYPENPDWMRIIWDNNIFFANKDGLTLGNTFGLKDAVFSNNKIVGNFQGGNLHILGSWCPNDCPGWSIGFQLLDNYFLQKNFVIELGPTTSDCLIKGNLKNVTVIDKGLNNTIIGTKN